MSPNAFTSHPSGANPTADSTIRTPLVTRKAEAHEPLAIQPARHLLQDRDAPGVDLDQVIVGGEDRGDFALGGEGRKADARSLRYANVEMRSAQPPVATAQLRPCVENAVDR